MFALCHRYITDSYEAEDVMMAGFMVVFSKIDQFSGEGNFEGWVRRIMVTQSLQFLRKSKSVELMRYGADEPELVADANAQMPNLDHEKLLELVQKLPLGYRMVFNLFAIEGYSHPEIGDMLGISEGSSKSQLHKARTLLQDWVLKLHSQRDRQN